VLRRRRRVPELRLRRPIVRLRSPKLRLGWTILLLWLTSLLRLACLLRVTRLLRLTCLLRLVVPFVMFRRKARLLVRAFARATVVVMVTTVTLRHRSGLGSERVF
jgi:hypothetical protein